MFSKLLKKQHFEEEFLKLHGSTKCDFGLLLGAVEHLENLLWRAYGSSTLKARLNIHSIIDFGVVRNAFMDEKFTNIVKLS